jgi:hypothetical protein
MVAEAFLNLVGTVWSKLGFVARASPTCAATGSVAASLSVAQLQEPPVARRGRLEARDVNAGRQQLAAKKWWRSANCWSTSRW